jgi:hypothetical protein
MRRISTKSRLLVASVTVLATALLMAALPLVALASRAGP